ncbi:MAG: hypothetical protein JKY52_13095 [Flavobacteriales bacterium]|nr:hypothetical protein [Flavobacteriales bacterium]
MKGSFSLFVLTICIQVIATGQTFQESMSGATTEEENRVKPSADSIFFNKIVDSEFGINAYENLNYRLGGDSSRMDKKGYAARGWVEDTYPSGTVLHRGYYTDGHLKLYKNHYPDGTIERSYRTMDNYKSSMEIFYTDGTLKSRVIYSNGTPLKWEDFYPSGKLEYTEEFNKSLDYYLAKKSFHSNGALDESLLMVKESKRLYESKQFNDSGMLVKEGKMVFNEQEFDYRKIGKWSIYDTSGKLVKEQFYVDGKLDKEKSL